MQKLGNANQWPFLGEDIVIFSVPSCNSLFLVSDPLGFLSWNGAPNALQLFLVWCLRNYDEQGNFQVCPTSRRGGLGAHSRTTDVPWLCAFNVLSALFLAASDSYVKGLLCRRLQEKMCQRNILYTWWLNESIEWNWFCNQTWFRTGARANSGIRAWIHSGTVLG